MARKTSKGDAMASTIEPESKIKPVRLDLAEDVHRLLRKVAAEHDLSMAAYARESLESHLREEAGRLGLKP